ncbi:MAG: Bug family tripartite tricarboxylate transporter substrate binding protein [Betaproteobacteria bacterium]
MKRMFVLAAALVVAAPALAQFPNKPIRIVVPFGAGSATDLISRVLGNSVSAAVGQPVVIDNKAGADGAIAASEVAKAAPDGYTLLMATNSPLSVVPAMKKSPPYDPVADFTPITDVGRYTFFIVVNPGLPARTLPELVQYAKANPGKINYATGNTTGIVSSALLASLAKIEMVHVPYKTEPQVMPDLVSGRVQMMFASSTTSMPLIRDGKLRPLVTTLPRRSHLLPDLPTIAEAGYPTFSIISWAGLFGPAKMPADVVARLNREFVAAMGRPDVQEAMLKQAFVLTPSTPEKLAAWVKEQLESYRNILKAVGIQPE